MRELKFTLIPRNGDETRIGYATKESPLKKQLLLGKHEYVFAAKEYEDKREKIELSDVSLSRRGRSTIW